VLLKHLLSHLSGLRSNGLLSGLGLLSLWHFQI
jgi:hypothetical protein